MERQDIKHVLNEISGSRVVETKDQGDWVGTHCPLAKWRHENGSDRNMSFGVRVNAEGKSIVNCYACKFKGTLAMLISRLSRYSGEDLSGLLDSVEADELLGPNLPEWDKRKLASVGSKIGEPLTHDYLDLYDEAGDHPYLARRGITMDTTSTLDLRYDGDDKGSERILFPVYGYDGSFYGLTGRAISDTTEPRIRDYFGLPKRHLLLGAEWIDPAISKYVIVVEGLFDFARLWQYGYPAVAVMHSGLTKSQSDILKEMNLPIYAMYDRDKAGREGTEILVETMINHVAVMRVEYPRRVITDKGVRRLVKDPDELRRSEVREMISRAVMA